MKQLFADLILINGNVITLEEKLAEAVAVRDGKIIFVGLSEDCLSYKGSDSEIIDLNGKTLMPGFIESHGHPLIFGNTFLEVDCGPSAVDSIEELLISIKEKAETLSDGQWILGGGWDDSKFLEKRTPTRWDLDKVAPNHPVFLRRTCGHTVVTNSKALELADITKETSQVEGGHIQIDLVTGEPTGILQERAIQLIPVPAYSNEVLHEGMLAAQKQFAEWGMTTIHCMSTHQQEMTVYQNLLKRDELTIRYRLWLWALSKLNSPGCLNETIQLGVQSGFGNEFIKIQGMKFMLDGSIGGKTAAVEVPYLGEEKETGILYSSEDALIPHVTAANQANLRVAIHAIGERAIDQALNIIEAASEEVNSVKSMRNRIEHCTLVNEGHAKRLKELGVVVGSSTGFILPSADNYIRVLGMERAKQILPHGLYKKYGIIAPGNSDLPVVNGNPFEGIYGMVTRKTENGVVLGEEHAVSVEEALKAFTLDAAYSSYEEDILGSIKVNKLADMIMLSDNPFSIDPEKLKDIVVEMTIMGGKIIFTKERFKTSAAVVS